MMYLNTTEGRIPVGCEVCDADVIVDTSCPPDINFDIMHNEQCVILAARRATGTTSERFFSGCPIPGDRAPAVSLSKEDPRSHKNVDSNRIDAQMIKKGTIMTVDEFGISEPDEHERLRLLPALLFALGVPAERVTDAADHVRRDISALASDPREACEMLVGSLRVGGYVT